MLRPLLVLCLSVALLACGNAEQEKQETAVSTTNTTAPSEKPVSAPPAVPDSATLIIPGEKIGKVNLGDSPEEVHAALGKPDAGNAAMGKAISTWFSTGNATQQYQLDVYTVRERTGMPDEAVRVHQIRTTSPRFTLPGNGLAVGSTLAQIKAHFPQTSPVAYYPAEGQKRVYLYDAPAQGIAFEITGPDSACVAISIHAKGEDITNSYLPVHPDLVRIERK